MSEPVELSLEQKFSLKSFETQVNKMNGDQARHFLVKLYEQHLVQETMYRSLLQKSWGIEAPPQFPSL